MNLPPGFDPDPEEWLETSYEPQAVLDCYPLVMRELIETCDLYGADVAEALPDADILDVLGLTIVSTPENPLIVTPCPDHPTAQEQFLADMFGMQLIWRIDEKFPAAVEDSPQLALRVLYNAIQEAKREKESEKG